MIRAFRPFVVALATAATLVTGGLPASAANSSITLAVVGTGPVTHGTGQAAVKCDLAVPTGADGLAVLESAKASGCIQSYEVVEYPGFGFFLNCIDTVCGGADPLPVACWYWALHLNGAPTEYGLDGYRAASGDVVTFLYAPYGPARVFC